MENKTRKISLPLIILIGAVLILGITLFFVFGDKLFNNNASSVGSEEVTEIIKESTEINFDISTDESKTTYSEYTAEIDVGNFDSTEDYLEYDSENKILNIIKAGTYHLTGTNNDLSINVKVGKEDSVYLVIENLNLKSNNTSAVIVEKAKEVIINVNGNENVFEDAKNYTYLIDVEEEEPDSTIFSKADLVINGSGTLKVIGNMSDAIASKDNLKIVNVTLNVVANDDGIRGKDNVIINSSTINIESNGDSIKSTNTDENMGNIVITDSKISIASENGDGIDSEKILNITNSDITIKTNGTIETKTNNNFYGRGMNVENTTTTSSNTSSSKGIKAGSEITINSGNYVINSSDDSIHSNGIIIINGGNFELSSSDDGIHADTNIIINDGNINIKNSYEGIESSYIEINGGNINVNAKDDGINVGGGNDMSAMGNRNGMNSFSNVSDTSKKLQINGGKINVTSEGDGLDSNGSIYIDGGEIIVNGPTMNGNGPLDYDSKCIVTGGTLISYGSNGMWQTPSSESSINTVSFTNTGKALDKIELKDSFGNVVYSVTTTKSYAAILFTGDKIKSGETYKLYVNDNEVSYLTVNSSVNGISSGMMEKNGGDMGGGMMPPNRVR